MSIRPEEEKRDVLLSTKLKMPSPRRNYVARRSLFQKLERCAEFGVIFVRGSAGMGKTTLLSSFIVETGLQNTAWLSLDENDNAVFPFWRYFTAAVNGFLKEKIDSGTVRSLFEPHSLEMFLTHLINRLCGNTDYYLVLDDFHIVTEPALVKSLEFFLRSMPENLHLFLLSRNEPPVYLGALAVSGKLLYIGGVDMRFSREESIRFLKSTMRLRADDARLREISDFAEGWVGGLQLAAACGDCSGELLKHGGGAASDYLTREVFEKLTREEQDFLVCTGMFSWFSAEICAALMDNVDFPSIVEDLQNKNLFVVCLDEEKGMYRYHNILGEYLKQRFLLLPEERRKEILQKASAAFAALGDLEEAVRLCIEAGDYAGAMEYLSEMESGSGGEYLNRIPFDLLAGNLDLAVRGIIYNIDCGNFKFFDKLSGCMLERWDDRNICALIRGAKNAYNRQDLASVPPAEVLVSVLKKYRIRPETVAFTLLGCANLAILDGRYGAGEQYAREAEKRSSGTFGLTCYSMEFEAQFAEETGRLNDGLRFYAKTKRHLESGVDAFMPQYDYWVGIAGIYLKRMELPKAKDALTRAQHMLYGNSLPENVVDYSLGYNWAEYDMLSGSTEKGAGEIHKIVSSSEKRMWADRLLNELCAAGLLAGAEAESVLYEYEALSGKGHRLSPVFELLCARLYFQKGEVCRAREMTEAVLAFSRENGSRLHLVEADLILLEMTDGTTPAGRRKRNNLLREAVYYSWENRILQPFYVNRRAAAPLWKEFAASLSLELPEGERQFVRDVTHFFSPGKGAVAGVLSAREGDVLRELARGKTNPEIAESLCISLSTVKTHVLNIYGKLGVSTRLSAVKEGERLGLLP